MIGVFVRFKFKDDFDAGAIRRIAEDARPMFAGMPGLRSKTFTFDEDTREAVNFYVWSSEEAARAFFTDEVRARVSELYGTEPQIQFVKIAALVEN